MSHLPDYIPAQAPGLSTDSSGAGGDASRHSGDLGSSTDRGGEWS